MSGSILLLAWLELVTPANPDGQPLQLRCGEFVVAAARQQSPSWDLTGALRATHRDAPRLAGNFNLIEGCIAPRLDREAYRAVFRNGYEQG